jgi:pyruvate dehydrogenase E1 component subunit beta
MAQMTYREALRSALREELARDERVFILGAEVGYFGGAFKVTDGLLAEFGERRVRDMPHSPQTMVGAGIGAALGGLKPIVESSSTDVEASALDRMMRSAGGSALPIVFRMVQQGAGDDQTFAGLFMNSESIRVVAPARPADAKGLLKFAIRGDRPVIFIENQSLYEVAGDVPDDSDFLIPFGKANEIRRGNDITIVAWSRGVHDASRAAEVLVRDGIEADVIDLRTLNPLDIETIVESIRKTRRAIVVSNGRRGSVAAEIVARIYRDAFGLLSSPIEQANPAEIVAAALRLAG